MPDHEAWLRAYDSDPEMCAIRDMVRNPACARGEKLQSVNPVFRSPLRQSLIVLENDMLILREPLGMNSDSYCKLRLVPHSLRNILFICFHTNPIGGHLNAYRTYSRMRMRFMWPGMYKYCTKLCRQCPGCALANRTVRRSAELVYQFPVTAPMLVLHVDGYQAGSHASFEGDNCYLVVGCGMSSFAACEPVRKADSTNFASALMKIMLRYGISHTLILDKDSKFLKVFKEVVELLKLNSHVLSSENHDGMIVERINRYLNKGLKILCNERDSVRVAAEALLLLIYAWNSAPIPGTDISRSLVVTGREFSFPIDFSAEKHLELTSSPDSVSNFAKDQAKLLAASRGVAKVLLEEHRAWHRELLNKNRVDPRLYSVGDIVFAKRAVRSDAARGRVAKIMYPFTGPWRVKAKLDGGSYAIEHCSDPSRVEKKHAAFLSPYPEQLVPFEPIDGPDNQYSQLYKAIQKSPFVEAGLKGFEPSNPFKVPSHFAGVVEEFHWPTLHELNEELNPFPWQVGEREQVELRGDTIESHAVMYTGPPPAPPAPTSPTIPSIASLAARIIQSTDKLFFIAHRLPNTTVAEWRLVRVAFQDSVDLHPSCLQDGKFLVEFYIAHTSDVRYNGINQRYWLQYHPTEGIIAPSSSTDTHLIRPSDTSELYAKRHKLTPFRLWVNLTHESTYIHGPFDFARVRNIKSRDRIDAADWKILHSHRSMYQNEPPKLDLPTYSIHVDRGVHVSLHNETHVAQLRAAAHISQVTGDRLFTDKRS